MTLETWLLFVLAATVVVLMPGPTVMLVISYALGQGARVALPMALGVVLGDLTAMTLSLIGLGTVLKTSPLAFAVLKWAGALYLIYLGVKLWPASLHADTHAETQQTSPFGMLVHAWLVTATNPKTITFFVAFFPQFIASDAPFLPQVLLLAATFLVLALINSSSYALLAAKAGQFITRPAVVRAIHRAGGLLLIATGIMTLLMDVIKLI